MNKLREAAQALVDYRDQNMRLGDEFEILNGKINALESALSEPTGPTRDEVAFECIKKRLPEGTARQPSDVDVLAAAFCFADAFMIEKRRREEAGK